MSQPSPPPDSVIAGRYRVVRTIGRGGMGVVLEAENLVTGKRIAIKCVQPFATDHEHLAARLVREARASARVKHPNVVDVYDVVEEDGHVYLVMELLEGEPLSAVLRRGGMPLHELIALLLAAMRGVAAAHSKGVIHRDIKPDNIFVVEVPGERGLVKVLDFGISRVDGARGSRSNSGVVGTPLYMSYEQFCNARDIDGRTDVYAFGVIVYEAMTGQSPYDAENVGQLALMIAQGQAIPPRERHPTLPRRLERVILQAIERDRDKRTPNIAALIRELTPFSTPDAFRGEMSQERALPRVIARGAGAVLAATLRASRRSMLHGVRPIDAADSRSLPTRRLAVLAFSVAVVVAGAFLVHHAWTRVPQSATRETTSVVGPSRVAPPASAMATPVPNAEPAGVEESHGSGSGIEPAQPSAAVADLTVPATLSKSVRKPSRIVRNVTPTISAAVTEEPPKTSRVRWRAGRAPEREEF